MGLKQEFEQSVLRPDAWEKASGSAKFAADLHWPAMLYAKTVRSSVPRGTICSIQLPPLPPDCTVVDYRDIPGKNVVPMVYDDQPFLAETEVNYVGEPILLFVGPDLAVLNQLLRDTKIDYELLPAVTDLNQAQNKAAENPELWGPMVDFSYGSGSLDEAAAKAHWVIEDTFTSGRQEHAYLETQAVTAHLDRGRMVVHGSMQCPYYVKEALGQGLGWESQRIRVVQAFTGGGFGGKEEFPSLPAAHAAFAALKTGKPVQLVYDRHEDMAATTKRHPSEIYLRSYVDAAGQIIGRDIRIALDGGAYAGLTSVVLQRTAFSVGGVYQVENLRVQAAAYRTNTVVSGAFRGFGGPQAFFAMEMHMEHIARRLAADSLLLRSRHFVRQGQKTSTGGLFRSPVKLPELVEAAAAASDYHRKRRAYEEEPSWRGIGLAVVFHGCGFTGDGEKSVIKARVRLKKYRDNTVEIFVSSTEIGQGVLTTLRKIVARTLEIPFAAVRHNLPDTDTAPDSGPTVASRTTMVVGRLLQRCALDVKARWSEPELDLVRDYEYPPYLHWDPQRMAGDAYPEYAWGANVVEAVVDPVTFELKLVGVWAAYDIGAAVDERIVRGQIEGGLAQGLGYAAGEVMTVENGRVIQDRLGTYILPTTMDLPPLYSSLIANPYEEGPFGAKGLGELPLVGVAPAVAAAVSQAIGKPLQSIPITPEALRKLVKHA